MCAQITACFVEFLGKFPRFYVGFVHFPEIHTQARKNRFCNPRPRFFCGLFAQARNLAQSLPVGVLVFEFIKIGKRRFSNIHF